MAQRKKIYLAILTLVALLAVLTFIIFYSLRSHGLKVIFLDVGQGDSILIEEGSNQILIDGGRSGKVLLEKLGKYVPFWDREIEAVIATHPDQDHIAGLADVLKSYQVKSFFETKSQSQTEIYKNLESLITQENTEKIEALKGVNIKLPEDGEIKIIYPLASITNPDQNDTNKYSVVAQLRYGENKFLFTGDLPSAEEPDLLSQNTDLKSDILKVAHHGSKYSTSADFLDKVSPRDAIISVGKNNMYGHPAPEIIERLKNQGIRILRTDESGDITYDCPEAGQKCAVQ